MKFIVEGNQTEKMIKDLTNWLFTNGYYNTNIKTI